MNTISILHLETWGNETGFSSAPFSLLPKWTL